MIYWSLERLATRGGDSNEARLSILCLQPGFLTRAPDTTQEGEVDRHCLK